MDGDDTTQTFVEEFVLQVEDELILSEDYCHDTDEMTAPNRPITQEWPPQPPPPADLAQGTMTEGEPVQRRARFYAAVRRPTTQGD